MDKYEVVRKIEEFAPLETQEEWDCSGWAVDISGKSKNVNRILFALTVTDKIIKQAREKKCDMIISHHPLFYVPLDWNDINIYCAHTNLDKADGGTTDTLIKELGYNKTESYEFVRIVRLEEPISLNELKENLLRISPKLRYINNNDIQQIKSIGFCAGSGSEFINETNTDAFVTGDLKFHTALCAKQVVFDIGHFESEIFAVNLLKNLTKLNDTCGVIANEKSPFI